MLEEVVINTRSHTEFVPLAQILEEVAARRGWRDGLVHVVVPHTTAGVTIQEGADPDVRRDMAVALEKAVPWESREYQLTHKGHGSPYRQPYWPKPQVNEFEILGNRGGNGSL